MKIGNIEAGYPGKLDAIHVPIAYVTCNVNVVAGVRVRFTDNTHTKVVPAGNGECHGLVNPFLNGIASIGDLFVVFVLPGLAGDLTHRYTLKLEEEQPVEPDNDADESEIVEEDPEPEYDECAHCYGEVEEDPDYEDDSCGCGHCYN